MEVVATARGATFELGLLQILRPVAIGFGTLLAGLLQKIISKMKLFTGISLVPENIRDIIDRPALVRRGLRDDVDVMPFAAFGCCRVGQL